MQTINLDISVKSIVPILYAKQAEVGRKFKVVLTDNGSPYVVPAGANVSIWFDGASGAGNYTDIGTQSAIAVSGNEITVEMIAQMLAKPGNGRICLVINAAAGMQIGTWNIPYFCEDVPGAESPSAEKYYTAFSEAISNLTRVVGASTKQGGEIFNDYENNQALAPYAKADGVGCRAGIYGYKLLAVEKDGDSYSITVGDAKLDSKAGDNYAAGDLLCVDGQGHFYDCLKITAITTNGDGNSVITVAPTDSRDLSKLAVDSSQDEWENWVYVAEKPDAGEPALVSRGAYAGGVGSVAVGYGAFAFGRENKAIGNYSYALGRENVAMYSSYAEGKQNTASGEQSHAEGSRTKATGASTHAEGNLTTASGLWSHAEGSSTTASGDGSHSEGIHTTASGRAAHAEGGYTTASGLCSHSEGNTTTAQGSASHAEGSNTKAIGNYSHAEGRETIAGSIYQHVQGKWNVEDTANKYAHIVGGGSSDTNRKNIYTLDWQGNAEFAGNVIANGVNLAKLLETTNADDANNITKNGIYRSNINTPTGNWGTIIHTEYSQVAGHTHQRYITMNGLYTAERGQFNEVWQPWEWINPPMELGVEYRTTERHQGKPVYVTCLNCGALGGAGSEGFTQIPYSFTEVIYFDMTARYQQATLKGYPWFERVNTDGNNGGTFAWTVGQTNLTGYTGYAVAKYIK